MAGGEARAIAGVHEGMAELGLNLAPAVRWAYRAEGAYDGWRHTSLRGLATLWAPQWLAVAVRWEARVTSLEQLAERRLPLRVVVHAPDGPATTWSYVTGRLLAAHGLSLAALVEWGGRVDDLAEAGDFDLLIAPLGATAGRAAELWRGAAGLRFLGLGDAAAARLERDLGVPARALPEGAAAGLGEGVRALWMPRLLLYASERLEVETARALLAALAAGREELLAEHAFLDAANAREDPPVPSHRGTKVEDAAPVVT
jgi:TRAP-type uncharacterized transport system substrate-binding protein